MQHSWPFTQTLASQNCFSLIENNCKLLASFRRLRSCLLQERVAVSKQKAIIHRSFRNMCSRGNWCI